jgi:hypothetical protein
LYKPGIAPERQYKRITLDKGLSQPTSRVDLGSQLQGNTIVIPDSPERVHKLAYRAFQEAETVSQLAKTDPFTVPRVSQLKGIFDDLSADEYTS